VALSATKSGVETSEPLCRVTFREAGAASEVTLGLKSRVIRSAVCEERELHLMAELACKAIDLTPRQRAAE
jgi:hypothetical protein